MEFKKVISFLKKYKRLLILTLTPIIFSPIVIAVDTPESRTAYGITIMATFWVTEVTPLPVTSLLPLLIFPFLGILKGKTVCLQYMKDTNILLLGGLLIAVAIEQWNVHKRVALSVLLVVGAQPRRLMLGFMLVTAFISMWITNTATTAMMTPIMEAVLKQLDKQFMKEGMEAEEEEDEIKDEKESARNESYTHSVVESNQSDVELQRLDGETDNKGSNNTILLEPRAKEQVSKKELKHRQLCKAMLLCICYSANIGGTGTLTGTAPQLVLAGQVTDVFKGGPKISFIYWFVYAFPQMLIFLSISWVYLQILFLGISFKHLCFCFRGKKRNTQKGKEMYAIMKKQYQDLGPVTFAEKVVMGNFLCLVLLWFFREPKFMPGWGDLFKEGYVSDGTTAIIIAFLLFQLPSQVPDCLNWSKTKRAVILTLPSSKSPEVININRCQWNDVYSNQWDCRKKVNLPHKTILEWDSVSKKFPWNVLFLLGAGFAIAKACEDSGLSLWLSCQLTGLKVIPKAAIVFVICVMITFLTEITSNTATATILLPILGSLGQSIGVHPYYMMIPATACASFAFMLPVATPPNAIVFGTGRLTVTDMAKAGFGMNLIGILVVTLAINTWGYSYYGLGTFPDWAQFGNSTGSPCGNLTLTSTSPPNTTLLY